MVCIDTDHSTIGKKLGILTAVYTLILFEEDDGEFSEGVYCLGKSRFVRRLCASNNHIVGYFK